MKQILNFQLNNSNARKWTRTISKILQLKLSTFQVLFSTLKYHYHFKNFQGAEFESDKFKHF